MLRITKSKNPKATVEYFTNALSVDDYYFGKEEVQSFWKGKAAEYLGLSGSPVRKKDFAALVRNKDPQTGRQLTPKSGAHRNCGVEFLFNSPKSISIHALLFDKALLKAHRLAVDAAMREVENDIHVQLTQDGRNSWIRTGNLIRADFEHLTTRPLAGKGKDENQVAPDMHLHCHSFVPSLSWNARKKRYYAIETGPVHKVAEWYQNIYHSVLAREVQKLGYATVRTRHGFELAGYSRATIEKFSGRSLEINALAQAKGITDDKIKSQLGARTRLKKSQQSVAQRQLKNLWMDRLDPTEKQHLHNLRNAPSTKQASLSAEQAVERALLHYTEREAAAPEKRILAEALRLTYGSQSPESIERAWKDRKDVLRGRKQGVVYATTREMVQLEEAILQKAVKGKSTVPPLNPTYTVERDFLNEQQHKAIHRLLRSRDQVTALVGAAGVGKTSLLQEVRSGIEEAGKRLFAYAPSADASRRVLREKGFQNSDTIASLLQAKDQQEQLFGQVLLIDEAGLVSTRDMHAIMEIADKQKARLILSGDPHQLSAVGAGSPLQQLIEKSQVQTATVNTVVRQQAEPYRQAIQQMAEGRTTEAYHKLDQMGAVKEYDNTRQRYQALAEDYICSLEQKRSAMIVAPTHAEKDALNTVIRAALRDQQMVRGEDRMFSTRQDMALTEAEKKDPLHYGEDTLVRFHRHHQGGFQAGKAYSFAKAENGKIQVQCPDTGERLNLPTEHTDRFQVCRKRELPLAEGDYVRITANGKNREGGRINNGQTYQVEQFTPEGHIRLSNGKTLDKDYGHIDHANVVTVHASQGRDCQDVYLSMGSLADPAIHRKSFYVAASRGTHTLQVYTDDKQQLQKSVQRSAQSPTALDIAEKQRLQDRQRLSREYYHQSFERHHEYSRTPKTHLHETGKTPQPGHPGR